MWFDILTLKIYLAIFTVQTHYERTIVSLKTWSTQFNILITLDQFSLKIKFQS